MTLHKLDEFLSGEIHEEMNESLRLKDQNLKLQELKLMTLNRYIKEGSNFLKENNIKSYMIDAELIMSSVSGKSRENLLLKSNFKLSPSQVQSFLIN